MTTATVRSLRPTVHLASRFEPPYDDERAEPAMVVGANALALPLEWEPREEPGLAAGSGGRPPLRVVPDQPDVEASGGGPIATARHPSWGDGLPAPASWAPRLSSALVEVAAGVRPPGQLVRWTSHDVWRYLSLRHAAAVRRSRPGRSAPRPVLRRVHVFPQPAGHVEIVGRFSDGARERALALRMEPAESGWRCTALSLG